MHPQGRVIGFEGGALRYETPSGMPRGSNESEGQSADKFREKRALGLLLSGLAQIFGYTVTPVQVASLPNARPMAGNTTRQQVAPSRPTSANATMPPRQRETIRFTGVVNFGNNSDILGHLQRYERIFHGGGGNATMRPALISAANCTSVDPRTSSQRSKAPLLTPFFVKIPLPIAPNLPPAIVPIGDLSYPIPLISIVNGSSEDAPELPTRKEQETVYRNNEDTERYTLEEKDIYDEKDVSKPPDEYTRESHNQGRGDRYDNVQGKQQEQRLKEQEEQRDRDRDAYYKDDDERYRNREEQIANRNRGYTSRHRSKEEKRPAEDHEEDEDEDEEKDEDSAERHEEHASQANESSKEPTENQRDKSEEDYSDRDDKPFDGYKYPSLDKYVETGYDRKLPIGDYFHEGNPEVIRDSYGEVLDNKNPQDDRLSGYFSMFKQPHADVGESQELRNPEDASSKEDEGRTDYDEHLDKLQKLRDEYALPESKYEEYYVNDEKGGDREDRESERLRNRTSKDGGRARTPTEGDKSEVPARFEDADSREEVDLAGYTPLVVPVRYIDAGTKLRQESSRRGGNEDEARNRFPEGNVDSAASRKLPVGLPERSRQLHEEDRKELQIWPPPFDYIFDNTEPANAVVPPDYQRATSLVARNDNDNSSQPSYVVVVGSPTRSYEYPYDLFYFPNEAAENPHPDTKSVSSRVFVPEASPRVTESNLSETARDFHRPRGTLIDHLDRYRYVFEERASKEQTSQSPDANGKARSRVANAEEQSSGTHRDRATKRSPPVHSRDAASSNHPRPQDKSSGRPRYSRAEGQREGDGRTDPSPSRRRSKSGDPRSSRYPLEKASSGNVSRVTETNAKLVEPSNAPVTPEVVADGRSESADATRPKRRKRKPASESTKARSRP